MARMKVEYLYHYGRKHGISARDRLMAYLPHYAPWVSRFAGPLNLGSRVNILRRVVQAGLGITATRTLPRWRRDVFREAARENGVLGAVDSSVPDGREVALFVDTFTRYFEPENAYAATRVLTAAGFRVVAATPSDGGRPLCCGRTFLSAGLVDEARTEARRMVEALQSHAQRGTPIIGLEPSCLLTLRDEFPALLGSEAHPLAEGAYMFEEFLAKAHSEGQVELDLTPLTEKHALVHGHCHEKAHATDGSVVEVLRWIPGLQVETVESSCCGMAGSFGYEVEHVDISMAMAELSLLPALRQRGLSTRIVSNGFSCRSQIATGTGSQAVAAVRLLDEALPSGRSRKNGPPR